MKITNPRAFLSQLFYAAVAAADPYQILGDFLPEKPKGRTVVVAVGKGAAQLAKAFERLWQYPCSGLVVTAYGHSVTCEHIKVIEAAHPLPDCAGLEASKQLFQTVSNLSGDDLVVALICGGGSALLPSPPSGCTMEDEQMLNQQLLTSGMPIESMNTIRKQFSRIKGGRLARVASPAKIVSLVVSDVPGDNPALVSSGPTLADLASREDALNAISHYKIELTDNLHKYLSLPMEQTDTPPLPNDKCFANNQTRVIASAQLSLQAAADLAEQNGVATYILSDRIEGEAREVAKVHAAIADQVLNKNQPFATPTLLLSGGETTVTMLGSGRGGRNTEFMLSLLMHIAGKDGIAALAADTDGIDGSENNAGAFADSNSLSRLHQKGYQPMKLLTNNDSWSAFDQLDDLFITGATGTNINDFRAVLIDP